MTNSDPMVTGGSDGIVVRVFRPCSSDDAAAKALESRSSQHAHNILLSKLVKVHFKHLVAFDGKARQYDDSVVFVASDLAAEDRNVDGEDGFVCGGICMGIKEVWLHGQRQRVGCLFNLRVHEDYQRRGVGSRLNEAAEQIAREREVCLLYLTVNSTNVKGRAFYTNHNYHTGSERALLFHPLVFVGCPRPVEGATIRQLAFSEVAQVVDSFHGQNARIATACDLFLTGGFGSLLEACPGKFLNAWLTELDADGPDGSRAAIILWDGDGMTSFEVERIILPAWCWKHPAARLCPMMVFSIMVLSYLRWLARSPWPLGWSALAWAGALVSCLALGLVATAVVSFAFSRERMRARLVAPGMSGPHGLELLRSLVQIAKAEAKQLGFVITISNMDIMDEKLFAFQSRRPSAKAIFLQKRLQPSNGGAYHEPLARFAPDCFFDPRDLS